MRKSHRIPDPVHGAIDIPKWLVEIENIPSVRRMMFIRQLGLKAYIDFPGAIHTRYAHVQGVMHLAGILVGRLTEKEKDKGNKNISKNLDDNKNNIMAAGFLHDIGHGPFSHAIDFVLMKTLGKSHEQIGSEIIKNDLTLLQNHGITLDSVIKIIEGKHDFRFISNIINGPLDVDKLDYLLRDAHHVGLKYGFDLEYFVNSYTVLGNDNDLKTCELGLDDTLEAQVTTEIFLLIWKSMYDLVYNILDSRIAEKMLEKAVLLALHDDNDIKSYFTDVRKFVNLYDDRLLDLLSECKIEYAKKVVEGIRNKRLFSHMLEINFYEDEKNKENNIFIVDDSGKPFTLKDLGVDPKKINNFIVDVTRANSSETDKISDNLSIQLSKQLDAGDYNVICDIIKSKVPSRININNVDEEAEPIELRMRSAIIRAMEQRSVLRVYTEPKEAKRIKENLRKEIVNILANWEMKDGE